MPETETHNAIELVNLTYTYPEQDQPALKDVTLVIEKGEYVVVVGPNGAGKTTLCLHMNGVIPNVLGGRIKGKSEIMGLNTRRHHVYDMALHVGIVLQDPEAQLFTSDVRSEVAFAAENLGVPREEMIKRIDWILDVVRLKDFVDRPPAQLSGGQKQRLAIASSLVMQPNIIVLDEPTSQLDPIGSQEVFSVLRDLNKELDMTVLISTHKSDYAAKFADRVVVLNEGKIVAEGPPENVFSQVDLLDKINVQVPAITRVEWEMKSELGITDFSVHLDETSAKLKKFLKGKNIVWETLTDQEKTSETPALGEGYVELDQVTFQYPGTKVNALQDVSLSVGKGEFVGIIGQNGAGKTTLVKNIIGLLKPTSGKILIDGKDISKELVEEMAQTIGLVLQNPDAQLFAMSVEEEVAFGAINMGFSEVEVAEQVEYAIAATGLEEFKENYPFNLSFGDRRKLSVAAVVSMNPDILIFDEPTTGQDYKGRRELADIARNLNERGRTIIMITHDMDLIAEYTRRLIVMGTSRILVDGPTEEVFQQVDLLAETFIEPPQITQLAQSLEKYGVPGEILAVEELCQILKKEMGK